MVTPQTQPVATEQQTELEKLLAKAVARPGIAMMLKAYDDAEAAYERVTSAANPPEYTSSSTNVHLVER